MTKVLELGDAAAGPFTQERFNLLPPVVSRQVFEAWTGLTGNTLNELVRSGEVQVWRPKAGGYAKYLKTEIGRLTRFSL